MADAHSSGKELHTAAYTVLVSAVEQLSAMVRRGQLGGTAFDRNFLLNDLENLQIVFERLRDTGEVKG